MREKRKHPLQVLAKYLKGHFKDDPKGKGSKTDYSDLIASYNGFVEQKLSHYLHDHEFETLPDIKRNFYKLFWKTFFDEVAIEANKVYELHREELAEPEKFWNEIQAILYDGLKQLKEKTA